MSILTKVWLAVVAVLIGFIAVVWISAAWPGPTGRATSALSPAEVTATATAVQIETRARVEAAERDRVVASSFTMFVAVAPWGLTLAVAGWVVWWAYSRRSLVLIHPEHPILHRRDIEAGAGRMALEMAGQALVARSRVPDPVPAQLTFSPSFAPQYSARNDLTSASLGPADTLTTLPPAITLVEILNRVTVPPGALLAGLGAGGVPVLIDTARAPHLLLAGQTGGGKSVTARALLAQSAAGGAGILAIDPHGSRPDWAPFASALLAGLITTPDQAAKALGELVREMEKRLDAWHQTGECHDQPLVCWIDEAPAVTTNSDVPRLVARVLREARKVNIRLLIGSQDGLCRTLGISTGERSQFGAVIAAGALDTATASALLGRGHGLPLGQLGQGIGAVRFPGHDPQLIRLPMTTAGDVQAVLAGGSKGRTRPTYTPPTLSPIEPPATDHDTEPDDRSSPSSRLRDAGDTPHFGRAREDGEGVKIAGTYGEDWSSRRGEDGEGREDDWSGLNVADLLGRLQLAGHQSTAEVVEQMISHREPTGRIVVFVVRRLLPVMKNRATVSEIVTGSSAGKRYMRLKPIMDAALESGAAE